MRRFTHKAARWPQEAIREIVSASASERRMLWLFVAAVAVFAVTWFVTITARAPLFSVRLELVRLGGFSREVGGTFGDGLGLAFALALASVMYLVAVWAVHKGFPQRWALTVVAALILSGLATPSMLLSSPDAVHLAADVRTLWYEHTYPTSRGGVPKEQDDPVAKQVIVYHDNPSAYGPVSYLIGGAPLPFVGDDLRMNIFGQKVFYGLLYVLVAVLAGVVARGLGRDPAVVTAFVGLNPMFLWQFPGDAHNDVIMMTFAMLSLLFLTKPPSLRHRGVVVVMGVLSALSKFGLAIAAGVVFGYWFPRLRVAAAIGSAVIVGAVATGLLLEVGPAGANVAVNGITSNTPWGWAVKLLDLQGRERRSLALLADLGTVGLTSIILLSHRLKTPQDLVDALALQLGLFLFLFTPELRQWYQFWAFPIIMLTTRPWLRAGAIVFSLAGFLTVLSQNFLPVWRREFGLDNPVEVAVGFVWLLTIAVSYAVWRRGRGVRAVTAKAPSRAVRRRQQRGAQVRT